MNISRFAGRWEAVYDRFQDRYPARNRVTRSRSVNVSSAAVAARGGGCYLLIMLWLCYGGDPQDAQYPHAPKETLESSFSCNSLLRFAPCKKGCAAFTFTAYYSFELRKEQKYPHGETMMRFT